MNILFATILGIVIGFAISTPILVASAYDRKKEAKLSEAAAEQALTEHLRGSK